MSEIMFKDQRSCLIFLFMFSDSSRLSIDHVDVLWECLATDPRSSDEVFIWLSQNVKGEREVGNEKPSLRKYWPKLYINSQIS
jgi:hypothetical protein